MNTSSELIKSELKNPELTQEEINIKTERLNKLKNKIEIMSNTSHMEVLYIISQNKNIKYSENSNGTFINLTEFNDDMIQKLENFVEYVKEQNIQIEDVEQKKKELENNYFKSNKE